MNKLNKKENVQSYKKVKALEATIASILNAQNADISLVISETQADINDAEHEMERQKQLLSRRMPNESDALQPSTTRSDHGSRSCGGSWQI